MTISTIAQRPSDKELLMMAAAIQKVLGSITDAHGADCLMGSMLAAEVLRQLGHDAHAVAGSAAWRIGKGDGDVITHAIETSNQATAHFMPGGGNVPAGLFHAWVEIGDQIVDFATAALPEKARILDSMDGGTTSVEWAPDVLWAHRSSCKTFREVATGYDAGMYAYVRHEKIEAVVFPLMKKFNAVAPAAIALIALSKLKAGEDVSVIGLGDDGPQTLNSAIEEGRARGFVKVNVKGSP